MTARTPQLRPGYGIPDSRLTALFESLSPVARDRVTWPGDMELVVSAYLSPVALPRSLVTSVRCVVRVSDRIVLVRAPDTLHIWPGGRRLPGESYRATARREVHEETGWQIRERDCQRLGFLHYRMLAPQPADHPFPHPDFLQVVYTAPAWRQDGDAGGEWADLDGWELGHRLATPTEIREAGLPSVQLVFLDAAVVAGGSGQARARAASARPAGLRRGAEREDLPEDR
jgi:ADP-ribose pyrophosphatase YjhB (NUDIX family)